MISKTRGVLLQKTGFLVKITLILGFDLFWWADLKLNKWAGQGKYVLLLSCPYGFKAYRQA